MHNKVVYRIARGMRRAGAVVLRFNFRGVGRSEGVHDQGAGEVEDARAALEFLRARYPDLPYSMAGFSFGSRVIMKLGCSLAMQPRPVRLIAVGFPTRLRRGSTISPRARFRNISCRARSTSTARGKNWKRRFEWFAEPKHLEFIEAGDHFFAGALDALEEAIRDRSRPNA